MELCVDNYSLSDNVYSLKNYSEKRLTFDIAPLQEMVQNRELSWINTNVSPFKPPHASIHIITKLSRFLHFSSIFDIHWLKKHKSMHVSLSLFPHCPCYPKLLPFMCLSTIPYPWGQLQVHILLSLYLCSFHLHHNTPHHSSCRTFPHPTFIPFCPLDYSTPLHMCFLYSHYFSLSLLEIL